MKIREVILEALSPAQQAVLDKIERGEATTSPEEREKRYRDEEKRKAAQKPDLKAQAAERQAEMDALAKKYGVTLDKDDYRYFMKGVEHGQRGYDDRGAGEALGPFVYGYDKGRSVGIKMSQESMGESATAGATSAGNIASVEAPHLSPGSARGKTSYTGKPGGPGGTKAPPQPKVKQPKKKDGTAKGAHEITGVSLFGGPAVVKR